MSGDQLEEEDLIERCKNCKSVGLFEIGNDVIYCSTCGTVDYTEIIKMEDYLKEEDERDTKSSKE